jgi:hypothetical protein
LTVYELAHTLRRRGVRVNFETLALVLEEKGRPKIVRISDDPERYALKRAGRPTVAAPVPEPWERLRQDLTLHLSDPALDVLRMRVCVRDQSLPARCDVVVDGDPAVWLTLAVKGSALPQALTGLHPRTLSPGLQLPLRPAAVEVEVPALLVWTAADPRSAASVVVSVLKDALGLAAERIRLAPEVCTPAEADRRVTGYRAVRRARSRQTPGGFGQATCLKCGQPLTHPESLRYGVGPECRRYYGPEYFRAMANPRAHERLWFGSKKPTVWLQHVKQDLGLA